MNEARTRPDKPTGEFNTGMDKRAKHNSKNKKMQILQFDTRLEKWDTELLWQGKEEGGKKWKKIIQGTITGSQ